jgi:hypothetical protein
MVFNTSDHDEKILFNINLPAINQYVNPNFFILKKDKYHIDCSKQPTPHH